MQMRLPSFLCLSSSHIKGFKCAQTSETDPNPWAMIDLGREIPILGLNVTLAEDNPVVSSLEVRIGNDSDHRHNPLCMWMGKSTLEKFNFFINCQAPGCVKTFVWLGIGIIFK